jgi:uncharacterized membrane protein
MIPRLRTIWQRIRSSLWAMPLAMTCAGAALAVVATRIRLGQGSDPVWFLYSGGAEQAPQFLSHLVTAMITMATLAISITMVVLALAAQQLGPRLIHNFMRDRYTQVSLGLLVATVVYLLLVLRSSYGLQSGTPNLAVTIGTFLVLLSVVGAPVFVHHLARSIIADNVILAVGARLDDEIRRLLPEEAEAPAARTETRLWPAGARLRAKSGGYVEAIDFGAALKIARDADVAIEFDVRAGHHVIPGAVVGWVGPAEAASEELCQRIAGTVLVGRERTSVQDLEFTIRHLVEIAVRALSPGINDPYTAMAVVDRLSLSLALVMRRGPAEAVWRDEDGRVRIVAAVSTFEGIVDAVIHQIRQRAAQSPDVLIRIVENLVLLTRQADAEQRAVLAKHIQLVLNAGRRGIDEPADLEALEERAAQAGEPDGTPAAPSPAASAREPAVRGATRTTA